MRSFQFPRVAARRWAVLALAVLAPADAVRADHLPLPQAEQADVNRAIDLGVQFLKKTQLKSGSWAAEGNNQVGYAALPGLTLLECGVAADDPVVQRAAAFVRHAAVNPEHPTERTYDLALTILFLDRLGEPKDEAIIHSMALRLVAGQSPSGGWGYKCPVLTGPETSKLFAVLHKIATGPSPIPLEGAPALASGPNPSGQPALNPGGLVGQANNGPGLSGTAGANPSSPGTAAAKSPGESGYTPGGGVGILSDPAAADRGLLALRGREESVGARHWAWCIKAEEDAPEPAEADSPKTKPKAPTSFIVPRPLFIPPDLRRFTVLQDFSKLEQLDPADKGDALIFATTDNSNTQFAILALWVAQRHDVPMERTLRLVTSRFQTSQNGDGSWNYRYAFGGGLPEGPAMDCVGLLGLAVGHGIAAGGRGAVNAAPDPAILSGFAALSRHVGLPAGKTHDLPPENLYKLWSIERVSVLYGLPTIADKDWYRWGAEILVANQAREGNWPNDGGYPGWTPMANTCLALLFLRKANLVSDLTAALPFQTDQLAMSIADKAALLNTPPPTPAPPADPSPPPAAPPAPPTDLGGKPAQPSAPAAPPPAARRRRRPATFPRRGRSRRRAGVGLARLGVRGGGRSASGGQRPAADPALQ